MTLLLPEEECAFTDVYLLPKFDVSRDSKLVILLTLSISKLIFILLTLGKSKLSLIVFFTTVDRSQLFYSVWVRHTAKNNPNALRLIKIEGPQSMIQSAGIKN